jgi:hypothetical protein
MMKNTTNHILLDEYCDLELPMNYELHWFIAYISLAFVGLFYAILGKRLDFLDKLIKEIF